MCGPPDRPIGRPRLGVALCALLALPPSSAPAQESQLVYDVQSRHQRITVLDTAGGYRQLIFDGRFDGTDAIQSEMNLANPDELTLSYARHMIAALPVVDRPRRILVVGLGGACIQRYLRRLLPQATIETVELDPEIRHVATTYFSFKEDAQQVVHLGDGRAFIERSNRLYDVIFLDAFTAFSIPYHLTTREFLHVVKGRLAEGGVVCANLWDADAGYWDIVRTYSVVFPELHVLKCGTSANSLVLAAPARMALTPQGWAERAAAFEKVHPTGLDLAALILGGAAAAVNIPDTAQVRTDKEPDVGSPRPLGRPQARPPLREASRSLSWVSK